MTEDFYYHNSKQGEVILKQFLHFSKCSTFEELLDLKPEMLAVIFEDWVKLLETGLVQTFNTIQRKIHFIQIFFVANDLGINFPEDSIYSNYE